MDNSNNNIKHLIVEKCNAIKSQKDISCKYKKVQDLISNVYNETNNYNLMLDLTDIDKDQKCKIEHNLNKNKIKLEKFIREKEVLKKDITILQHRIKYLENEINKSKSFWQRIISFI